MKGDHWPTVSHSLIALRNQCTFITECAVRLVEVETPNTLFGKAGITKLTKKTKTFLHKMLDEAIISLHLSKITIHLLD